MLLRSNGERAVWCLPLSGNYYSVLKNEVQHCFFTKRSFFLESSTLCAHVRLQTLILISIVAFVAEEGVGGGGGCLCSLAIVYI